MLLQIRLTRELWKFLIGWEKIVGLKNWRSMQSKSRFNGNKGTREGEG